MLLSSFVLAQTVGLVTHSMWTFHSFPNKLHIPTHGCFKAETFMYILTMEREATPKYGLKIGNNFNCKTQHDNYRNTEQCEERSL